MSRVRRTHLVHWPKPGLREIVELESAWGLLAPMAADAVKFGLVGACPECGGTRTNFGAANMVPGHPAEHDRRRNCPGTSRKFSPASRFAVLQATREHFERVAAERPKAGRIIKLAGA